MTSYDRVQLEADAGLTVRGPRGLARLWAIEMLTLRPRYSSLERAPVNHPWLARARVFLGACVGDGVDPARIVAALFDYARVQKRRGRPWWPTVETARSDFARRVCAEWEARQRAMAASDPATIAIEGQRLAARQASAIRRRVMAERGEDSTPAEKSRPAPTSARVGAIRRRSPKPVAVPKNLTRDPARTEAALLETLDRDAAVYAARRRMRPGLDPATVVELDPLPYSPTFRRLVGCAFDGDVADPLAAHVLIDGRLALLARRRLIERGLPASLLE